MTISLPFNLPRTPRVRHWNGECRREEGAHARLAVSGLPLGYYVRVRPATKPDRRRTPSVPPTRHAPRHAQHETALLVLEYCVSAVRARIQALTTGSGREIVVECHGTGVYYGVLPRTRSTGDERVQARRFILMDTGVRYTGVG